MASTTTIRIDANTHAQLLELSRAADDTLVDTVRAAAEALRRQRFGRQVANELDELAKDPDAWAAYLADAEVTAVRDGIG